MLRSPRLRHVAFGALGATVGGILLFGGLLLGLRIAASEPQETAAPPAVIPEVAPVDSTTTSPSTTTPTTPTTTVPPVQLLGADPFGGTNVSADGDDRILASWEPAGRVSAAAGVAPFDSAEEPEARAWVASPFVASASDAVVRGEVWWDGVLRSGAGAGVVAEVTLSLAVLGPDGAPVAEAAVLDRRISSDIGVGADARLVDRAAIALPVRLAPGARYTVRLELRCTASMAFGYTTTECRFDADDDNGRGAGWSGLSVVYGT